ncbi:MAG: TlpA disulfide reductase family protein [Vicinamibacterales bacterium]
MATKSFTRPLIAAGVLIIGIGLAAQTAVSGSAPEQAGAGSAPLAASPDPLPKFAARALDGQTVRSDQWRGKVTLVNFWATWCSPCRAEIPDLLRLQTKYRDHLRIIGISADEGDVTPVKNFAAALRMDFPIVMLTPELDQLFGGVHALPVTVLVDREGRMVKRHLGAIDARQVELEVRALAGLPPN